MSTSRYIHGTDPAEQARLTLLNDLLNASCLRELAVSGGERILDVGAGLGQLSRAMARAAGRAVVGLERSEEQIARAQALAREAGEEGLLELRRGDALSFPLEAGEWGRFDVAHARFILEHVPAPERVVEQMVRAVRPGGRVVLSDDDHSLLRLHPEPPGLRAVWDAFARTYDRNGNDPYVGRRLAALLHGAGARPRRYTWLPVSCCAGEPGFGGILENLAGNLRGAREAIAATGAVTAGEVDAAVAALRDFTARPEAALGYAFPWAEGVRPGP
jgi:SAM-dependent methyltransferase